MNEIVRRCLLPGMIACVAIAPAQADGLSDLQTKLDSALKSAKSFVVTTLYPDQAYSATLVFVAPDRTRVAVAVAASTTDVVTVGRTVYSSKNGAPFERSAVSPEAAHAPAVGSVKVTGLHPDVTAGGLSYGAFVTTVPFGKLVTLTCTYDKKSYRLIRCANDEVTQTYTNYNYLGNTVEVPKNAIDAPKVEVPKDVK